METHQDIHPDRIGRSEYRIDAGFIFGYVLLFFGLFVLDWDPRYIFLGVTLELAIAITGYLAKAWMLLRSIPFAIALFSATPAIVLALVFSIFPLVSILQSDGFNLAAFLGIVAFLTSTLFSQYQRFRRTTLRQARFFQFLNRRYQFEDGKPVFGSLSLLISPVVETWLTTGVFLISWMIALGIGSMQGSESGGFNVTGAAVLAFLCLVRQLTIIGIMHHVYRNRDDQETFWVEHLEKGGKKVVPRSS